MPSEDLWWESFLPEDGDWIMFVANVEPWPMLTFFEDRTGRHAPYHVDASGRIVKLPLC